ncbi:MAG: type II toxin-antitoxin system VapC family toxin [Methanobrevibacter sp.]|nr:type II toxin-antitoxin system VapC family toxin [Methanobrevibacter sp.]
MIFVDTTFLIALLIKTDPLHEKALEISETIHERKVINNTVLNETLNAFTGKGGKVGKELYQVILEMFDVKYLDEGDYEDAINIYLNFNSSINYSDCTILSTMIKSKINRIVTFDSDFNKIKGITVIN